MSALGGVNGTVCNAEQYLLSQSTDNPTISCLTHGQSIGLALTAESSFLSFTAVMVVFVLIGRNVLRYRKAYPNGGWRLLRVPADIYMLSLFVFDIMQALGGILDVRWAHNGIVTTGEYCTAQGIIQQIGELGVALITLILTIHTFVVALWNVGMQARCFAYGIVALASLFIGLWVGLGNSLHRNYETPTPYWCWIGAQYNAERLGGEYVWFWIALFASGLYIPLYFWAKGCLSIDPEKWYKFRTSQSDDGYSQRRAALGMLFYPLAYSITVLPVSIARWSLFNHKEVSSAATFFGASIFNLSGALNVLLLLIVRPQLLLFIRPEDYQFDVVEAEPAESPSGSPIIAATSKYNRWQTPQQTEMPLPDVAEDRAWDPTLDSNSIPLARLDSSTDDV